MTVCFLRNMEFFVLLPFFPPTHPTLPKETALLCFLALEKEKIAGGASKPLFFPATLLLNPDLIDEIPLMESSLRNTRRKGKWEQVRLLVCSYNKMRGQKPGWG